MLLLFIITSFYCEHKKIIRIKGLVGQERMNSEPQNTFEALYGLKKNRLYPYLSRKKKSSNLFLDIGKEPSSSEPVPDLENEQNNYEASEKKQEIIDLNKPEEPRQSSFQKPQGRSTIIKVKEFPFFLLMNI